MHKCKTCGTEFEGKFCPECGAKFEENVCPECGARLAEGVKFCPECGTRLAASPAKSEVPSEPSPTVQPAAGQPVQPAAEQPVQRPVKQSGGTLKKVYGFLRYVPLLGLALFSALCFLFYLGDIATVSLLGMSEGIGNLYQIAFEGAGIIGTNVIVLCYFLLLLPLGTLIFSGVALLKMRGGRRNNAGVSIGSRLFAVTDVWSCVGCGLFFLYFLLGCIACGMLNDGLVQAGAAPVLVLVFSLILGLAGGGAMVARFLLGRKNPEWVCPLERKVKARRTAPDTAEEPDDNFGLPLEERLARVRDVKIVVRRSLFGVLLCCSIVFPPLCLIAIPVALTKSLWDWTPEATVKFKKRLLACAIVSTIFAVVALYFAMRLIAFSFFAGASGLGLIAPGIAVMILGLFYLAGMIVLYGALPAAKRLHKTLWKDGTVVESGEAAAKRYRELAETYRAAKGKKGDRRIKADRLFPIALAAVVLFCAVSSPCLYTAWADFLRLDLVSGITSVMSAEQALGAPDLVNGMKPEKEYYNSDDVLEYFGSNYRDLLKRAQALEEEYEEALVKGDYSTMTKLEQEIANIMAQAEDMTFKYVRVTGSNYDNGFFLCFDTVHTVSGAAPSSSYVAQDVQLSLKKLNSVKKEIPSVRITYTNGSYAAYPITPLDASAVFDPTKDRVQLEWIDPFFGVKFSESMLLEHTLTDTENQSDDKGSNRYSVTKTLTDTGDGLTLSVDIKRGDSSSAVVNLSDAIHPSSWSYDSEIYHYLSAVTRLEVTVERGLELEIKKSAYNTFGGMTSLAEIDLPEKTVRSVYCDVFRDTALYNDPANWTDGALYVGDVLLDVKQLSAGSVFAVKEGTYAIPNVYTLQSETRSRAIFIPSSVKNVYIGGVDDYAILTDGDCTGWDAGYNNNLDSYCQSMGIDLYRNLKKHTVEFYDGEDCIERREKVYFIDGFPTPETNADTFDGWSLTEDGRTLSYPYFYCLDSDEEIVKLYAVRH